MNKDLSDFGRSAVKLPTNEELIALAKSSRGPVEIGDAFMSRSKNPPFWPDDKELVAFYIQAKSDEGLDFRLFKAALATAPAREAALLQNRVSDRQGAFTHFICPDRKDPMGSRIFKVVRAPQVGSGTGGWGGLKEGDDVDVRLTVNREVFEEISDAVKLALKIGTGGKADALEQKFDSMLKDAAAHKTPMEYALKNFITDLGDRPDLQGGVQQIADHVFGLIDGLVAAEKTRLFQCRDDTHAIERGWGFKVDAFAHVAELSPDIADKFHMLNIVVKAVQSSARSMGLSTVSGEVGGIEVYALAHAAEQVKKTFYGHEGLAEIVGFTRLSGAEPRRVWDMFTDSGAVAQLAGKMRLTQGQLGEIYNALTSGAAGEKPGYLTVSAEAYELAHAARHVRHPAVTPI